MFNDKIKKKHYAIFLIALGILLRTAFPIFVSGKWLNFAFVCAWILIAWGVILLADWLIKKCRIKPETEENKEKKRSDYRGIFFDTMKWIVWVLLGVAILTIIGVGFMQNDIYQALAILFFLIWLGIFIRYFLWAVYHYNINYGLTNKSWAKIDEAKKRKQAGIEVDESELKEPEYNPYRSQTFGLPPGTVRGMIAFTLLFGAVTILIAGMGMGQEELANSLIRDQFEFFKTAFLMMIAFYFGDKSLKYLQKRWKLPESDSDKSNDSDDGNDGNDGSYPPSDSANYENELAADDQNHVDDEDNFEKEEKQVPNNISTLKNLMNAPDSDEELEYIQLLSEDKRKVLADEDLLDIIAELEEKEDIILDLPVLKAIIKVESDGKGHLPDGRAKIRFEGHRFWHYLKEHNKNPEELAQQGNEDIIYPNWTTKYNRSKEKEYERFERAFKIDKKAAIYSTSWGLFQIMGENLENNIEKRNQKKNKVKSEDFYKSIDDFVKKQHQSERYHLLDFLAFIKTKPINKNVKLINYVSGHNPEQYDWDKFAYGYNGSGYKKNNYNTKLKNAYEVFAELRDKPKTQKQGRIPIIDAGHGGMINDKYTTKGKRFKFTGRDKNLEIFEGVINRMIAQKLIEKLRAANIEYFDLNSTDETDMRLADRVEKANMLYRSNDDYYYLSIHSNSASATLEGYGSSAHGFEIFTSKGETESDKMAKIAAGIYKDKFPEKTFRGVKEANFYVLKNTRCPALLVENLFFDNYQEAQFLSSKEGQDAIADCLFETVKAIAEQDA